MKCLSLLLSMFVVTAMVAQKPLDRGIHKRKTGGVSFLFGKEKGQAPNRPGEEVTALKTLAPSEVILPMTAPPLMEASEVIVSAPPVQCSSKLSRNLRTLLPLRQRDVSVLVGPVHKKQMQRRPHLRTEIPGDGESPYDWASITGLALGTLALLLIDSGSELMPLLWLLGLAFSTLGLIRTKKRNLRGRKLAVWGVVLFGITPLAILLGVVIGAIGVF